MIALRRVLEDEDTEYRVIIEADCVLGVRLQDVIKRRMDVGGPYIVAESDIAFEIAESAIDVISLSRAP